MSPEIQISEIEEEKKHANYKDFVGQKYNFNKILQKYRTINTEIQKNTEVTK